MTFSLGISTLKAFLAASNRQKKSVNPGFNGSLPYLSDTPQSTRIHITSGNQMKKN